MYDRLAISSIKILIYSNYSSLETKNLLRVGLMEKDYLTVPEFAQKTGHVKQTIYKRIYKDLAPFVIEIGGQKCIKKEALSLFKMQSETSSLDEDQEGTKDSRDEIIKLLEAINSLQAGLSLRDEQFTKLLSSHEEQLRYKEEQLKEKSEQIKEKDNHIIRLSEELTRLLDQQQQLQAQQQKLLERPFLLEEKPRRNFWKNIFKK